MQITRRAALRGTAAVAAASAVPSVAAAHSDDAHLRALYDEWDALWKFLADVSLDTSDEDLELPNKRLND